MLLPMIWRSEFFATRFTNAVLDDTDFSDARHISLMLQQMLDKHDSTVK
jgi:hypothetical protein